MANCDGIQHAWDRLDCGIGQAGRELIYGNCMTICKGDPVCERKCETARDTSNRVCGNLKTALVKTGCYCSPYNPCPPPTVCIDNMCRDSGI